MSAAKSTVTYLRDILPGQPEAWYERIAGEILAGRMPLPKIEGVPSPNDNPAPPAKPKSKTKQLKKGSYQAPQPKIKPKPSPNRATPQTQSAPADTAGAAIRQALNSKAQSKPASAKTKWKLESLVHGDKGAAARLAAQVAFAHPDKTEQWCWEKAIFDLTRDRY